jgi:hypothetical protein
MHLNERCFCDKIWLGKTKIRQKYEDHEVNNGARHSAGLGGWPWVQTRNKEIGTQDIKL